jgi:hypothetical protein
MNPFQKHGIEHLSPSSINCFIAQPAYWVVKYLAKCKDDAGPAAYRGHAVQHGLEAYMTGSVSAEESVRKAMQRFTELTAGAADDAHEQERALSGQITANGILQVKGKPMPISEHKVELSIDGVEVPLIGYIDWLWEKEFWDLKTTKAVPSKAKIDHLRQMSLYSHATGLPATLLYLGRAKAMRYEVTTGEVAHNFEFMKLAARNVRHILDRFDSAEEAAKIYVPDYEHFMWSDAAIDAGHKLWRTQ